MSERDVSVRPARVDELPTVMNVLDGAMLVTVAGDVEERIRHDDVLVAVDDASVVGVCVLDTGGFAHVDAVAVRPRRRGQDIGRALLVAAADRHGRLTADFDERVRGFYESLGFEIEPVDDHYRGVWRP